MHWSLVSTGEVPWKIAHGATGQRSRYLCVLMPLVDWLISSFLSRHKQSLKVKVYFQRNPETPTENSESPQDIRETMT